MGMSLHYVHPGEVVALAGFLAAEARGSHPD
jgi:hypothetical protein